MTASGYPSEGKAPSIIDAIIDGTWKPPVINLDRVKRFEKSGISV
jgi:hypothetical protein